MKTPGTIGRSRAKPEYGNRLLPTDSSTNAPGEIRLVDFEPARGAEVDKLRPAVIVSNDGANLTASRLGRGVLVVVPITSNVRRIHPFDL
jgi:hypothetical protein